MGVEATTVGLEVMIGGGCRVVQEEGCGARVLGNGSTYIWNAAVRVAADGG